MDPILLGHGIFYINNKPTALTKGGGKFTLERDYREIEVDGTIGPVKGLIDVEKSVAKLEINQLTIIPKDFGEMYPAMAIDIQTPGTVKITGTATIKDSDYQSTVHWIGKTIKGKPVKITLHNAINLENIDWDLQDKSEVVNKLTYTATYDLEQEEVKEPWDIEWGVEVV